MTASAPAGAVIGVIGDDGSGKRELLALAGGVESPLEGSVTAGDPRVFLGCSDGLEIAGAGTFALYHALALKDAAARARASMDLDLLRRRGGTAFLVSHELDLIRSLADEVWWLRDGRLEAKGDPGEVTALYSRHCASRLAAEARGSNRALPPSMRKGDGRATLESLETLDGAGVLTSVWRAGEPAQVRVRVKFAQAVEDPVVGILVRTRIGFEVFGTNTQLEGIKLGPRAAGDTIEILFRFVCVLCPQEYTLTAASHDPDGVWHDWIEEGIAFSVADHRYTAGVACMRVEVSRSPLQLKNAPTAAS